MEHQVSQQTLEELEILANLKQALILRLPSGQSIALLPVEIKQEHPLLELQTLRLQ